MQPHRLVKAMCVIPQAKEETHVREAGDLRTFRFPGKKNDIKKTNKCIRVASPCAHASSLEGNARRNDSETAESEEGERNDFESNR